MQSLSGQITYSVLEFLNDDLQDMGVAGGKAAAPDNKGGGIGRAMGSYIDTNVTWSDVAWIRDQIAPVLIPPSSSSSSPSSSSSSSLSTLHNFPIGVKGIQSASDALLAISHGARIIWLSNHGGRGLDTAPPALFVLLELRRDHSWVFDVPGVEFWVDGGVRRGTDVVKALCLGAKGVAMGRMFVYALMYGVEGVRHAVQSTFFPLFCSPAFLMTDFACVHFSHSRRSGDDPSPNRSNEDRRPWAALHQLQSPPTTFERSRTPSLARAGKAEAEGDSRKTTSSTVVYSGVRDDQQSHYTGGRARLDIHKHCSLTNLSCHYHNWGLGCYLLDL